MAVRHSFDGYNDTYREGMSLFNWGRGGYTLYFNDSGFEACAPFIGVAICCPGDRYSRPLGRKLAEARYMQLYQLYPQGEVVNGRFAIINMPHPYINNNDARWRLHAAATLHALAIAEEYYPSFDSEIRIVNYPVPKPKKKEKTDEQV